MVTRRLVLMVRHEGQFQLFRNSGDDFLVEVRLALGAACADEVSLRSGGIGVEVKWEMPVARRLRRLLVGLPAFNH